IKKMSKSDPSSYSRIMLTDSEDVIVQKIRKAKTDPLQLPSSLKDANERPEVLNLLTIYAALNNTSKNQIIDSYAGKEFSQFKKDLADLVVEKIIPISKEMKKLMNDNSYLDSIMKNGKEKAIGIAEPVLKQVYEIIGLSNN
ncbi:tryptophan--tRNA ligase, partial [Alphaproteobacteria bacterium]|nr:tryptophan--tRNA ligase [Alphaproteobacteria bacterium]